MYIDGKPMRNYIWRTSSIKLDEIHTSTNLLNKHSATDDDAEPCDSTSLIQHRDPEPSVSSSQQRNKVKLGMSALLSGSDSRVNMASDGEANEKRNSATSNDLSKCSRTNSRSDCHPSCNCYAECTCSVYTTCSSGQSTLNDGLFNNLNNNSSVRSANSNPRSLASLPLSNRGSFSDHQNSIQRTVSDRDFPALLENVPEGDVLNHNTDRYATDNNGNNPRRHRIKRQRSSSPGSRPHRRRSNKPGAVIGKPPSGRTRTERVVDVNSEQILTPPRPTLDSNLNPDVHIYETPYAVTNLCIDDTANHNYSDLYFSDSTLPKTDYGPFQQASTSTEEVNNLSNRVYI